MARPHVAGDSAGAVKWPFSVSIFLGVRLRDLQGEVGGVYPLLRLHFALHV